MKNKFIGAAGILLITFVAFFLYDKYRIAPAVKFDTLRLTDLDGNQVSLEQFKDKKLFINFFATWCGSCLSEMPSLEAAQIALVKHSFQFILISDEPLARLKRFSNQSNLPFIILHSDEKLSELKIFTVPTTYVLNLKREVVFKKVEVEDWANETMINQLKKISG